MRALRVVILRRPSAEYGPKAEVLYAVQRASARSAHAVHVEMKRGLGSLASIAFSAPLVGVIGSLWGITYSFRGISSGLWSEYADIVNGLSLSVKGGIFATVYRNTQLPTGMMGDHWPA